MSNIIKLGDTKRLKNILMGGAATDAVDDSAPADNSDDGSVDGSVDGSDDGSVVSNVSDASNASTDTFEVPADNELTEFINALKSMAGEPNNQYFNSIITELNTLPDFTNLEDKKKTFLIGKITELQKEDTNINRFIDDIIKSEEGNQHENDLFDFKLELYKLQINTIISLLKRFNIKSSKLDEQLMDLLKITTKKFKILNSIITDTENADVDMSNVANTGVINNVVKANDIDDTSQKPVIDLLSQLGGAGAEAEATPDYAILLSKFNSLFSFFKTDLLVKIVFLAGYFNKLDNYKGTIKDLSTIKILIVSVFKLYFIENIENDDDYEYLYTEIKKGGSPNFDVILTTHTDSYNNVYNTTDNNKKYLFIPLILRELVTSNKNLTKQQDILKKIFKKIVKNFVELVKKNKDISSSLYLDLIKNKNTINDLYKNIIDKNKVVLTYIKKRNNTSENPRYTITKDSTNTMLGLEYKENDNTLEPDNTIPTSGDNFYFGPFDQYFNNDKNKVVANKIASDIKTKLLDGESYCIIGYGQSGSGKTSTLIQLKIEGQESENGILLHLLDQEEIKDKYTITVSGNDIRNNFTESSSAPTGTNRYSVKPLVEENFDYKDGSWTNTNTTNPIYDNLPDYIIGNIEKGRPIFPTPNNPQSSRSHMIIVIDAKLKDPTVSKPKPFKLFVCDLAGFENTFDSNNSNEIKKFFEKYKESKTPLFNVEKCKDMGLAESKLIDTVFKEIKSNIDKFNTVYTNKKKFSTDINDTNIECTFKSIKYDETDEILQYVPKQEDIDSMVYFNNKSNWANRITQMLNFKEITDENGTIMFDFIKKLKNANDIVKEKIENAGGITPTINTTTDIIDLVKQANSKLEKKLKDIITSKQYNEIYNGATYGATDWKKIFTKSFTDVKVNKPINSDVEQTISSEYYKNVVKPILITQLPEINTLFTENQIKKMYEVKKSSPAIIEIKNKIKNVTELKTELNKPIKTIIDYIDKNHPIIKQLFGIEPEKNIGNTFLVIQEKLKSESADNFLGFTSENIQYKATLIQHLSKKEDNPEQLFKEDIMLKIMKLNCELRVKEGKMINTGLIEMRDQIKDLIIEKGNIPEESLYWDTLYHPYCYNLNIMSNDVFVKATKTNQDQSIIVNKLRELIGGPEVPLKFIIFTVLNTNFEANNPPNPPYYNINNLKFYYLNGKQKELRDEMLEIYNKAMKDPFYQNSFTKDLEDKLKDFKNNSTKPIDDSSYEDFIKIFENNNSATLIGTLEATEKLQKLNMNYLCYESKSKKELLKKFKNSGFDSFVIIGNEEYNKKYVIYN